MSTDKKKRRQAPATTAEAREKQLISLAVDLAEQQLAAGTASSQVITHYLKLGSSKETLEKDKLKSENELLKVKTDAIKSAKTVEQLYEQALTAMRNYSSKEVDYSDDS